MDTFGLNSGILLELCEHIDEIVEEIKMGRFNRKVLNLCLKNLRINLFDCKGLNKSEMLDYFNIQNDNLIIMNPEKMSYKYFKAFYYEIIKYLCVQNVYYNDSGYESN